ncbi:Hypothetical predicted protein, partial [Marmota monax]
FQKWKGIAIEKYELEAARTQAAGQNSSDSKYFSCLSTTTKLLPTEEHDFQNWKESSIEPCMLEAASTQAAGENSFDSEYVTFLSTTSKPHPIEEH